jgi:hypothetical protein
MSTRKGRAALPMVMARLQETHPSARYELDWETPVQLLVATILAAQCTDERVSKVTRTLFQKYPDAKAFAEADLTELEEHLRPTETYEQKARAVQGACRVLVDRFGGEVPNHGYLASWAEQGMLMLNAVLTVRAHTPNSHKDRGWEQFTDAVIKKVNDKKDPVVFVLWGGYAKKKAKLIDAKHHTVIQGTHPSPLSAHQGFFGSRPFSTINAAVRKHSKPEINWQLPDV